MTKPFTETRSALQNMLGDLALNDMAMDHMHVLCDVIGERSMGSRGEVRARDYIHDQFEAFGLTDVAIEPFQTTHWVRGVTSAKITSPIERPIRSLALPMNGSHNVEAPIVWTPFETEEEFGKFAAAVRGKICVVPGRPRGRLTKNWLHRMDRIRLAAEAGAVGFLWASNREGQILPTGAVGLDSQNLPALGITREDGLLLHRLLLSQTEVRLAINTENRTQEGTSWNVVGEIPGSSPDAPVVMVTAHYDSHDITEGAIDNASGCAVILETARILATHYRNQGCRFRFAIFSGEEHGLLGSMAYVQRHKKQLESVRLLINVDGVGDGSMSKYVVVPFGRELVNYIESLYSNRNMPAEVDNILALVWDHGPFALTGVPSTSLSTKASDGYSHTNADTLDKVSPMDLRNSVNYCALLAYEVAIDEKWSIGHMSEPSIREHIKDDPGALKLLQKVNQ